MKSPATLLLALLALAAAGCRSKPTYARDVAPLFASNCVQCHRAGGAAPVPLLETGPQAVAYAGKIKLALRRRMMPPWGADNTGLCRTWKDAHWLDPKDVETLIQWTESPDPGPASMAPLRSTARVSAFGPAGTSVDTGAPYTPGIGSEAYRCFVADPHLVADALAAAFRVSSTDARSVQQVTLYALDSSEADQQAQALDDAEKGPGYTCYGSSRIPGARLVTSWTWDSPVLRMPQGYGVRLSAGHKLVVQVHYNVIASGFDAPTRTRVDIELDPKAREASFLDVSPRELSLKPLQTRVEARAQATIPSDATVLGVVPRMHTLGQTLQVDVQHGAEHACAANFDHWNFYQQRLFVYQEPLEIRAGDQVHVSCVYTTQSRSEPVQMGESIRQEECLASLLVAGRPARVAASH